MTGSQYSFLRRFQFRWIALWYALSCIQSAFAQTPPVTFTHGPFEITTSSAYQSSGGIFSTTGNRRTTVEAIRYTVKYKGELVKVQNTRYVFGTKAREDTEQSTSRFWGVGRLMDAPRPALLVATTDIWLLTEENGRLVSQSFNLQDTGDQWLDADQGQPARAGAIRTGKASAESGSDAKTGRWLLLGPTVLDVRTLTQFKVPTSSVAVAEVPFSGLQWGQHAVAFSPGQTQFVTVGTGWDSSDTTNPVPALVVTDIQRGALYGVKLSRKAQHYENQDDINRAWFEHYFVWSRDAKGVEKLTARTGAKPLPWLGRLRDSYPDLTEYSLAPARPELAPAVAKFISERMSAAPA